MVKLGEWVGDAEGVLKVFQGAGGGGVGELQGGEGLVEGAIGGDFGAVGVLSGDTVKRADDPGEEIGGHFGGGGEGEGLIVAVSEWSVGNHEVVGSEIGDAQSEVKGGLGGRFVNTGEGIAGVMGLKLSGGEATGSSLVLIGGEVAALHIVAERGGEAKGEGEGVSGVFRGGFRGGGVGDGELVGEGDSDNFAIVGKVAGLGELVGGGEADGSDLELVSVEFDGVGVGGAGDLDGAGDGFGGAVDFKIKLVVMRGEKS